MNGKPSYMKFVNYQIAHLSCRLRHIPPVKNILHHPGTVCSRLLFSPYSLTCNSLRIRIKKNIIFVKKPSCFRIVSSVNSVCIFKFLDVQSEYDHGIYIPDSVCLRKRQYSKRFFRTLLEQKQLAAFSMSGMNCKINAALQGCCAFG